MNNGLKGRYLPALERWNRARKFAAELVEEFYDGGIENTLRRWRDEMDLPSRNEIKMILQKIHFLDGHETINVIARKAMHWVRLEDRPSASAGIYNGHPVEAV